jgi:hypothetical protein
VHTYWLVELLLRHRLFAAPQ